MPTGSPDTVQPPPSSLRCPHIHNTALDKPTSINPNPKCDGRCIFVAGHPHPGAATLATATIEGATQYLIAESVAFAGTWQYTPGGCCKCEKCHKWVKDWGDLLGSKK